MIKQIINGIIIILCMILFIEAVAHIFGLLGQIIFGAVVFIVLFVYGMTRNPYGLSDEVLNNNTPR